MKLDNIINRFDITIFAEIIGNDALSIVSTINDIPLNKESYVRIFHSLYSEESIIDIKKTRDIIIDVLNKEECDSLVNHLGESFNDRIDIYTQLKSICDRKSKRSALYAYFGITESLLEGRTHIYLEKCSVGYPLFEHQRRAISDIKKIFSNDEKRVMLHMPTGSGKTRTAIHLICNHLVSNEPTIVVWLANSEELCEQTYAEFKKAWMFLGNREINAMKYWGGSDEDITKFQDGLIICGLQKLNSLTVRDSNPICYLGVKASLVLIDEAHIAVAETYRRTLNFLTVIGVNETKLIGLSATPGRTWNNIDADDELASFFNKKKVTLRISGYDNPIDYLVDNGYLSKVIYSNLFYGKGNELNKHDIDLLSVSTEVPVSILRKLSEDKLRNICIINKIRELLSRHNKIIVFAPTVEASDILAKSLQALGIIAFSVTDKTLPNDRYAFVNKFKNSDTPIVLCNFGILTTGFDAPKTSCAIIARPTMSLVLYSQMIGRAIRGVKAGGNKESEIVTVIDNSLPGFKSVSDSFINWEDVW